MKTQEKILVQGYVVRKPSSLRVNRNNNPYVCFIVQGDEGKKYLCISYEPKALTLEENDYVEMSCVELPPHPNRPLHVAGVRTVEIMRIGHQEAV